MSANINLIAKVVCGPCCTNCFVVCFFAYAEQAHANSEICLHHLVVLFMLDVVHVWLQAKSGNVDNVMQVKAQLDSSPWADSPEVHTAYIR